MSGPIGGRWTPVLRTSSTSWLGLRGDDTSSLWVGREAPQRVIDLSCPVGGLPLLERPRSLVVDEVRRASAEHGREVAAMLARVVPAGLFEAALTLGSDYWLALTLPWLGALGASNATRSWASRIEAASGASPSTRDAARRLRRLPSQDPRQPTPGDQSR